MEFALPAIAAVFAWWFSTGIILFLIRQPAATYRYSMLAVTVVLGVSLAGLASSASDTSVGGAYTAFASALGAWAWLETSYLTGVLTGPECRSCPPGAGMRERFRRGLNASLYHELAVLALVAVAFALAWNEPNRVGVASIVALWLLRWSAKLNLFLGVPNLNEQFLPEHLRFLKSYTRTRAMNPLFPVSVTAGTLAAAWTIHPALIADASPATIAGATLVTALTALGILEHWFMVVPLGDAALWNWAMGDSPADRVEGAEASPRVPPAT